MIRVQFNNGDYINMDAEMSEVHEAISSMSSPADSSIGFPAGVVLLRNVNYILDLDQVNK